VRAIHTKLFRDMWNMRGAVITIALVVGSGVAAFVTLRGTYLSMIRSRDQYYSAQRFGDVFAQLERAPDSLHEKLEDIPGVARAYTRVMGAGRVPLAQLDEPAAALVLSLPEHEKPPLNGVVLMNGRLPNPERDDEALLVERFAVSHAVQPGDALKLVIEGRERMVQVVGIVMSPEFVLSVPPGATAPAPERFAVLWMPRPAVEAAFDMRGAFNDVVLDLAPAASEDDVVLKLDELLDPYGGLGAQPRARQTSNYYLTQDMAMLGVMATMAPFIFMSVAAFLLNVVLSRLVELDRPQIATLKAVGYTNSEVGLHYLQLTLMIALGGSALGLGVGAQLGGSLVQLYTRFYRMPALTYRMDHDVAASALLIALFAGLVGSALAVRRVMRLPPAEAMRPVAPPTYKRATFGTALLSLLTPAARMVGREIMRRPGRMLVGATGIAAATGLVMMGQFFVASVDFLFNYYVPRAQSETLAVAFVNPVPEAALHRLAAVEGVRDVQWQSMLSARARHGHRERIVTLIGRGSRNDMRPLLDDRGNEVAFGADEVLFTETLARLLEVKPGDSVRVEPMQGERTPITLTMTGTVSELMGLWIHVPSRTLFSALGQAPHAQMALLFVDADKVESVQAEVNDMPMVSSVLRKDLLLAEMRSQTGDSIGGFASVLTLFAVVIALCVVYNNARVALSMRARELASLRVLGFTRGEISSILIGELGLQVILGIPLGLVFGRVISEAMISSGDPEAFRFPSILTGYTLSFAALVVVVAAVVSALLVRRKLDKLDLIEVLKTRE
jgi:putative ABC transport system permease protein